MHPRVPLQEIQSGSRPVKRRPMRVAFLVVMLGGMTGAASGQTAPAPAALPVMGNPVAAARCLAGEGCGASEAPVCAADETIKSAPAALKTRALSFSQSELAADCRTALAALMQQREQVRIFYQNSPQAPLPEQYAARLRSFHTACLMPPLGVNEGPVSPAQSRFLRDHIGLIVRHDNPNWSGPQPICQAARLGRFIVTAQRCIPPEIRTGMQPGGYSGNIAFRFFDSPTLYGLTLRRFGTGGDPRDDQDRDYAIFEIGQTPFLDEAVEPLIDTMQPFGDFITITAIAGGYLTRGLGTGAAPTLSPATYLQKNTLCRPAHVAANGILLHGCIIESALSMGAPLFQRQDGRLVFVGMHLGDTASLRDPSLAACAPGLNKYGIAIPPALLREILLK